MEAYQHTIEMSSYSYQNRFILQIFHESLFVMLNSFQHLFLLEIPKQVRNDIATVVPVFPYFVLLAASQNEKLSLVIRIAAV